MENQKEVTFTPGKLYRIINHPAHAWIQGESDSGDRHRCIQDFDGCHWVEHWPVAHGEALLLVKIKDVVVGKPQKFIHYVGGDRHYFFLFGEKLVRIVLPIVPDNPDWSKVNASRIFEEIEVSSASSSSCPSFPENCTEPKSL